MSVVAIPPISHTILHRASFQGAAANSWVAQARLPRAPILFAVRPKGEHQGVYLLRLGSWFQRRACPTGVAVLSWSYAHLPPKGPGKRSNRFVASCSRHGL